MNPRKSGDDRKAGTRFAACDQPLLAIYRSDANGCPVALCQRRQPPKAGAVGQRLQRVAGQPSLTIKSDGWFPVAAGPPDPRAALCEDDLDSGTDSAPFMRGFSPPPTEGGRWRGNACRSARRSCSDAAVRPATAAGGLRGGSSGAPWTNRRLAGVSASAERGRSLLPGCGSQVIVDRRRMNYRAPVRQLRGRRPHCSIPRCRPRRPSCRTLPSSLSRRIQCGIDAVPRRKRSVGSWGGRERRAAHRGAPEGRRERGKGGTRSRQGGGGFYAGYAQPSVAF